MIPVQVKTVFLSKVGFAVLLTSEEDPRTLPIFIGIPEAQAIAVQLRGIQPPRPLTHDLLKNLMERLGGDLLRVEIHTLEDGVFFAHLVLHTDSGEIKIDARPSDGIALALRCHAPILVARSLLDEAGVRMSPEEAEENAPDAELTPDVTPGPDAAAPAMNRLGRLKADLESAVREERYEDAARIRDEIRRLSEPPPQNHN